MRLFFKAPRDTYQWHRWFAWFPIFDRWADNKVTMVWGEAIERRRVGAYGGDYWEYRPMPKETSEA